MVLKLEKARRDNWTKRFFFDGTSAKLGPSIDKSGQAVTGLKDLKEETKFEKALGLPAGTLSKVSPYWTEFMIVVDVDGVKLDEDDVQDQLKLAFLKAQSNVANGTKELLTNPKAEYVLYSEEEEKIAKNAARRTRNKVMRTIAAMTEEEQKGMVLMYGLNPANMSPDAIEDFVYDKGEGDPKGFDLLVNDPSKEDKIFVHTLVKAGLLETRGGAYLYNDENLGYGLDAVAGMLSDKKHQELRIALEKQLIDK
jgi:hypothetical protein